MAHRASLTKFAGVLESLKLTPITTKLAFIGMNKGGFADVAPFFM